MIKMYTKSHDKNLLDISNIDKIFSSDEKTQISMIEYKNFPKKYSDVMNTLIKLNYRKLRNVGIIRDIIGDIRVNVLSLGAGDCLIEHLLQYSLGNGSNLTATDFDRFHINNAKNNFKNISCEVFDFAKDNIDLLEDKFDIAIMIKSSYVLNNKQYLDLLDALKKNGVSRVIELHGGILGFKDWYKYLSPIAKFKKNKFIRKLFLKNDISNQYLGKFHGYMRSKKEILNLYRKAHPVSISVIPNNSHQLVTEVVFR